MRTLLTSTLLISVLALAACTPAQPRYTPDGKLLVGPDPDSAAFAIQNDNLGGQYNPGWRPWPESTFVTPLK